MTNPVVLKVGGSILDKLSNEFFKSIVELKESNICNPIIVHGGGPEINQALEQAKVKSTFVDGLRVTTTEVLKVAETVMSGTVNKKIVQYIHQNGGKAFGLSGVDGSLIQAMPVDPTGKLGFVGEVHQVNTKWLQFIQAEGCIPVISPIGIGEDKKHYNINGDMAAAGVAQAMKGKLIFITDIPGVMEEVNGEKMIHRELTQMEIEEMITNGIIYGGMIPKVRSALHALSEGVKETVIINGFSPKELKGYFQGEKVGTKIKKGAVHHA